MFIVFPLVTFMDYGQIKYFKIEKLKYVSLFVFKELFNSLQLLKDDIMKRQHFWRRRHLLRSFSTPENASKLRRFSDALS